MTLPSGITSAFIKPTATIIAPGLFTLYSYLAAVGFYRHGLWEAVVSPKATVAAILLVGAIGVGMIIENFGSRIELKLDKKINTENDHIGQWYDYLACVDNGLVGFKYISTIVVRLKFELAMAVSSILVIPPLFLVMTKEKWECWALFLVVALLIATAGYAIFEAKSSIKLLANTRGEILKRLRNDDNPAT